MNNSSENSSFFKDALLSKKMIVCVGAGGVGKTTIAAMLSLKAAQRGKRAVCITIDPAQRLADILGVFTSDNKDNTQDELVEVDKNHLNSINAKGSLHFGMLDAKEALNHVVLKKSSSKQKAEKILNNKLYKYVSSSLSGIQEYMALEKLCQLQDNPDYDFIVLDTPPASNVIDFFMAPAKMKNALDGPIVRMMRAVYGKDSKLKFDFLGKWAMSVFNILSKITGGPLLDEIMEFVDALSDLFGNFSAHADQVENILTSPDVNIVLMSRPNNTSINETANLQSKLLENGFHVDGIIFNQCTTPYITEPIPKTFDDSIQKELIELNEQWNTAHNREQSLIYKIHQTNSNLHFIGQIPHIQNANANLPSLLKLWDKLEPSIN